MLKTKWAAAAAGFLLLVTGSLRADISTPITVPLWATPVSGGGTKLGIYVGIGTGATPALFEFDTGGPGFYAAYSPVAGVSPWWGSDVNSLTSQPAGTTYDSGLQYSGNLATAAVTLYGSASASSALVTTPSNVIFGQMSSIVQTTPSGGIVSTNWDSSGSPSGQPPIDGAFYGDFGMSSMYATNTISNLVAQLNFINGVTAGFRVHVDLSGNSWVQIGLTAADTESARAAYFDMNVDTAAGGAKTPNADLDYFSEQIFNANITLKKGSGETLVSMDVGMTPDTGATPALHNTQLSPDPLPTEYDSFIDWDGAGDKGELKNNVEFHLSGTTTDGETKDFFRFNTSETGVSVQNNHSNNTNYYLNTGLSFFEEYDVIYDWEGKKVGIEAVPEASAVVMVIFAAAAGVTISWVRKNARRRKTMSRQALAGVEAGRGRVV